MRLSIFAGQSGICFAVVLLAHLARPGSSLAEDGYRLWLRYDLIDKPEVRTAYRAALTELEITTLSPTLAIAKEELRIGLLGLLGKCPPFVPAITHNGALIVGTPQSSKTIARLDLQNRLQAAGAEGFVILATTAEGKSCTVVAANSDIGVLYGVFHLLRLLQTHQSLDELSFVSAPRIKLRLLNHWDNLDRTVERGYAGFSLGDWHKLPNYLDPRYKDYARANASIGINGTVLTNVNANAWVLTPAYLEKVAALAIVFRPYDL